MFLFENNTQVFLIVFGILLPLTERFNFFHYLYRSNQNLAMKKKKIPIKGFN
jgi:hypothetical protein